MTKPEHRFSIAMLRVRVMVCFHDTTEAANKACSEFIQCDIDCSGSPAVGWAVGHLRRCAIWIGPQCKRSQVFHECYHAGVRILREIGADGADEEVNAHLHEYITERVLTAWEKSRA